MGIRLYRLMARSTRTRESDNNTLRRSVEWSNVVISETALTYLESNINKFYSIHDISAFDADKSVSSLSWRQQVGFVTPGTGFKSRACDVITERYLAVGRVKTASCR